MSTQNWSSALRKFTGKSRCIAYFCFPDLKHYSTSEPDRQQNNTYTYDMAVPATPMPDEMKNDSAEVSQPSTNEAESDSALPAACESAGLPGPGHLPIDAPERRRLPPLLRRCWFNLNQTFRRRIAHIGVTPDQFTVMRTLTEGNPKGLTQRELTDLMSSDPNTMASLLERMEDVGLIERKQHEKDRRAYRIRLKPIGRRKYDEVREIAVALQTEILAVLPAEKREEFLEHLALVAESCRVAAGTPSSRIVKT